MFVNLTRGDFIFCDWKENGWNDFRTKEHQLRLKGFRKTEQSFDYLNMYITYKYKKKHITLTMLLS